MEHNSNYQKSTDDLKELGFRENQISRIIEMKQKNILYAERKKVFNLLLLGMVISILFGIVVAVVAFKIIYLDIISAIEIGGIFTAVIAVFVFLVGIASLANEAPLLSYEIRNIIKLILGLFLIFLGACLIYLGTKEIGFGGIIVSVGIIFDSSIKLYKFYKIKVLFY